MRKPLVAGQFYESGFTELDKQIKEIAHPFTSSVAKSFIEAFQTTNIVTENALTRLSTCAESVTL